MNRSNSRSKWKDVLGFDDGSVPGAATTYRYTPVTSPSSTNLSSYASDETYPDFPRAMKIAYHPNPARRDLLIKAYLPPPKYGPEDKDGTAWLPKTVPLFYLTVRDDDPQLRFRFPRDRRSPQEFSREGEMHSSRPELLLHDGPRPSNRVLAQAKFHSVTMCTDITLSPAMGAPSVRGLSRTGSHGVFGRAVTSPSDSTFEKPQMILGKDDGGRPRLRVVRVCLRGGNGFFRSRRWGFELGTSSSSSPLSPHEKGDGQGKREWFEWKKDKSSGGAEAASELWCGLDWSDWGLEGNGQSQKLKLVSSRSGEVLAGFVRADEDEASLGVFKFYGDVVGGEFDVLAILSLLSVVERGRRRGSNRLSKAFRND